MDALGDIKQLQLEQKRKAQAIDKNVNPPMIADPSMKNEPASLLPGAVTSMAGLLVLGMTMRQLCSSIVPLRAPYTGSPAIGVPRPRAAWTRIW